MKKIVFALLLLHSITYAQSKLSLAEYWIDSDPGLGKATAISGFPVKENVELNFNIPSNMSAGIHTVGMRSKDETGKWSHTNFFPIHIDNVSKSNLVQIEYFLDTDPGFGKATAITGFPAQENVELDFTIPTNIALGMHTVGIRSKSSTGKWSHTNFFLVNIADNSKANANITRMEYFWDTDPGLGKATSITSFSAQANVNLNFTIPTNSSSGIHTLGIRSKDANEKWSHTSFFPVYIDDSLKTKISQIEYFWDTDPGLGKAKSIASFPTQENVVLDLTIPANGSLGIHTVGMRSKDANEKWSHTNFFPVSIADSSKGKIKRVEYFWDTDPGFGNATDSILSSPVSDISNGLFKDSVPFSFLLGSTHILFERSMDTRGRWSHTNYIAGIVVTDATSIQELNSFSNIAVFPNPFSTSLNLKSNSNGSFQAIIYDMNGKKVFDKIIADNYLMDTKQLVPGSYILFVKKSGKEIYRIKLIKELQ